MNRQSEFVVTPEIRHVSPDWHVRAIMMGVGALAGLDLGMTAFAASDGTVDGAVSALGLVQLVMATTLPIALLLMTFVARAERVGRRRSILQGLVGFLVGSVVAAAAPGGVLLTAGRLLQVTLALALAGVLALCGTAFDSDSRVRRFLSVGAAWCAGLVLGPVLGHLLLQVGSWRLLFAAEAVFAAVLLVLASRVLIESRVVNRPPRGDLRAAILAAAALFLLCLGGELLFTDGATLNEALIVILGLLCAGVAAVRFRRRRRLQVGGPSSWAPGTKNASLVAAAGSGLALASTTLIALFAGIGDSIALLVVVAVVCLVVVRTSIGRPHRRLWIGGSIWLVAAVCWVGAPTPTVSGLLVVLQGVGIGIAIPALDTLTAGSGDDPHGLVRRCSGATATRLLGAAVGVLVVFALHDASSTGGLVWLATAVGVVVMMIGIAARRRDPIASAPHASEGVAQESLRAGSRGVGEIGNRVPAALLDFMRQRERDPLASLPMFSGFSAEQLSQVRAGMERVEVTAGVTLYDQGDSPDALYLVSVGRLALIVDGVHVRDVQRGEVLGVSELLTDSPHAESVVAARDSIVQRLPRAHIVQISDATFMLAVSVSLAQQLRRVTARLAEFEPPRSARDVVIAVVGVTPTSPVEEVVSALTDLLRGRGDRVLAPGVVSHLGLERAEDLADHVVLSARSDDDEQWREFCLRASDRMVIVTTLPAPDGMPERSMGSDVVIVDAEPSLADWRRWDLEVGPSSRTVVKAGAFESALPPLAARILGRSIGVAFGGGGARGLAHIGVLEVLEENGLRIDRVAGTSMGAIIGCLVASGLSARQVDAACYEMMVKRAVLGDYTLPRVSLLRGARLDDALDAVFGAATIESLPLPFACVSVDLVSRQQVVHRRGIVAHALAASSRLPGVLPPYRHEDGGVHVDGGLVNNLPVDLLTGSLGPVIAVHVGGKVGLDAEEARVRSGKLGISETIMRSLMLASDNANVNAIARADILIQPDTSSAALTEFFQIDALREAGRAATLASLPEILALVR